MIILITGDRNWEDEDTIREALDLGGGPKDNDVTQLAHGNARGADKLAGKVAAELGYEVFSFPANWAKYGRAAGPIRNREMLDLNPDVVYAFHNDLASSKGTKDCVKEALKRGLFVYLFDGDDIISDQDELKELVR